MRKEQAKQKNKNSFTNNLTQTAGIFAVVLTLILGLDLTSSLLTNKEISQKIAIAPTAKATSVYHNFSGGNLTLTVSEATKDNITTNNDWSKIPSVEGYCGDGLTTNPGTDPRTVTKTEYANNALPAPSNARVGTCVNADKGNPSAYNGSGITEFDRPKDPKNMAFGFQGNVQNNPYLVFYLNTTGQTYVRMSYDVIDIDEGNNSSYSQMALQYRVGETGDFINLPDGYVADGTDGPNVAGRITSVSVTLPPAALNQPKVQVRIISTFASDGPGSTSQTPNEWIGVNNVIISNVAAPTAASVTVTGRALNPLRRPIPGAMVTMTDSTGNTRTAITNSLGYYRFEDVQVGDGYVFSIFSKRYAFTQPTQYVQITGEENLVNFFAGF